MKAMKVLETTLKKSRVAIVSEALVEKQQCITSQAPVQLRRLDPTEYLSLQAEVATLQQLHEENRRLALKKRPATKEAADATAATIKRIDEELTQLEALRHRIAKEACISRIAKENQGHLRTLMNWNAKRLEQELNPNQRQIVELEREILRLFLP
jgi:hypothetical protein